MRRRTEKFFQQEDSPHGIAKKVILYRYLESRFSKLLKHCASSRRFRFIYFDAFAGAGKHVEIKSGDACIADKDIPYKDRTYGSPLVAMHALFSAMERNGKSLHTDVLLVFEDTNPAYLKSLIGNIKQYCNEKPKIRDGIEYFTNITVNEVDEKNLSCTITNRKKKKI